MYTCLLHVLKNIIQIPLSPEEALASFDLNKDFNIELFAAEPFVLDPVEMAFDEQGNAFVVEMPDYPFRPESGIGTGSIRMLSDTNGDGRIDKVNNLCRQSFRGNQYFTVEGWVDCNGRSKHFLSEGYQ